MAQLGVFRGRLLLYVLRRLGQVDRAPLRLRPSSLEGPCGQALEQTWATFHFDADGKLIRRIKRFISSEATKSILVVWKEWEIGSGVSADALLESAKDE